MLFILFSVLRFQCFLFIQITRDGDTYYGAGSNYCSIGTTCTLAISNQAYAYLGGPAIDPNGTVFPDADGDVEKLIPTPSAVYLTIFRFIRRSLQREQLLLPLCRDDELRRVAGGRGKLQDRRELQAHGCRSADGGADCLG